MASSLSKKGRSRSKRGIMAEKHVDYDDLAATYDQRFASADRSETTAALQTLVQALDAGRLLEVGCGTGHWLAELAQAAGGACKLWGLDISAGMLAQARARGAGLRLVRGRAGQLPYPDGAFDLVYCVNALHHFQQQRAFVAEARRLLRPGGALAVIGMDPHAGPGAWYIYDYFAGTLSADLARFRAWDTVQDWMNACGLEQCAWQPVERIHVPQVGRAVLDDPFLRKESTSQLALLSDEAYARGLARIEAALADAEAAGKEITFHTNITIGMLVGWAPEAAPGRWPATGSVENLPNHPIRNSEFAPMAREETHER